VGAEESIEGREDVQDEVRSTAYTIGGVVAMVEGAEWPGNSPERPKFESHVSRG